MYIVPPPSPEVTPARPATASPVSEAPPAPQVIYVRNEAPHAPPVVVSKHLGASVSLRVPKGLRRITMPLSLLSDSVTPRGSLPSDVQIPLGVITIGPSAAAAVYEAMIATSATGALGLDALLAQSNLTECDRVISLSESGGIRHDLGKVLHEIPTLGGFCDRLFKIAGGQSALSNCGSVLVVDHARSRFPARLHGVTGQMGAWKR